VRHGLARRRLAVSGVAGTVVFVAIHLFGLTWAMAMTTGWSTAAAVFLVWMWLTIGGKDAVETAEWAQAEDLSRAMADVVLLTASVASLIAVGFTLIQAGNHSGAAKWIPITLAVASVALAWGIVHTVYTVRYGDLYYSRPFGGIDFNEEDAPNYADFAYVALTIGMTFQVSDTDLQSKAIRRSAIRHALLSYVFGVVIIAITINIVAGLVH
jgi:uncharacterized membrane protein